MKRIIYILIGIALLSLSSCSDFLEPKSQSEYVPKDANALQEMLIGSAYPRQDKGNSLLAFLSFFDDDIQFHKTDYEFSINSLKDEMCIRDRDRPMLRQRKKEPLTTIASDCSHNGIL